MLITIKIKNTDMKINFYKYNYSWSFHKKLLSSNLTIRNVAADGQIIEWIIFILISFSRNDSIRNLLKINIKNILKHFFIQPTTTNTKPNGSKETKIRDKETQPTIILRKPWARENPLKHLYKNKV